MRRYSIFFSRKVLLIYNFVLISILIVADYFTSGAINFYFPRRILFGLLLISLTAFVFIYQGSFTERLEYLASLNWFGKLSEVVIICGLVLVLINELISFTDTSLARTSILLRLIAVYGKGIFVFTIFMLLALLLVRRREVGFKVLMEYEQGRVGISKKYKIFSGSNVWPVLGLSLILLIFVAVKFPYMDLDFTGLHNMKYSSYVEPALHMLNHGWLWNEHRYLAIPAVFDSGVADTWGSYPMLEWGLYGMFKYFPYLSVELNTRILMTVIGVFIIIVSYLLLKRFLSKENMLVVLFLMSLSPLIQFITFVTVYDTLLYLFTIYSLLLLIKGMEEGSSKSVFLAGIVAGININLKYSAALFALPLYAIAFLFYKRNNAVPRFRYALLFLPQLLLQTIIFRLTLRYAPQNTRHFVGMFIVILITYLFVYFYLEHFNAFYDRLIKRQFVRRVTIFLFIVACALAIIAVLKVDWVKTLGRDFVTDRALIFYWPLYNAIAQHIVSLLTFKVAFIALPGLLCLLLFGHRNVKLASIMFLTSSVIYVIMASKVIYFHDYYLHIVIITVLMFSAFFIYSASRLMSNRWLGYLVIVLFLLSFIPDSIKAINNILSRQSPGVKEVANYLNNHMTEDEFFISSGLPTSVTFYANRKSFEESILRDKSSGFGRVFSDEIASGTSLGEAAKKYKIKYYVINRYTGFAKDGFVSSVDDHLLSDDLNTSDEAVSFRTKIILCQQDNLCGGSGVDQKEISKIFGREIAPFMHYETTVGFYEIYNFY